MAFYYRNNKRAFFTERRNRLLYSLHTIYPITGLPRWLVMRLPRMQKTWVQSLGREDLMEKEMAAHSSILAWKIPWTEEPGRLQSMGSQRVGHD